MVARGTKTKLSAKPVMRMGSSSVYGPMSRLTVPKIERADAEADEADGEQIAIVDAGAKDADDGRAEDGSDAARADDEAGGEGGVAEDLLVEERQDGDGEVDAHAEQRR